VGLAAPSRGWDERRLLTAQVSSTRTISAAVLNGEGVPGAEIRPASSRDHPSGDTLAETKTFSEINRYLSAVRSRRAHCYA
jgi:hypothetical protein